MACVAACNARALLAAVSRGGVGGGARQASTASASAAVAAAAAPAAKPAAIPVAVALPPSKTGIVPPPKPYKPRKQPPRFVRPEPLPPIVAEYSISRSITAAPPGRMSTAAVLGEDAAQALAGRVADAATGALHPTRPGKDGAGAGASAAAAARAAGSRPASSGSDSEGTIDVARTGSGSGSSGAGSDGRGSGSASGSSSGRAPSSSDSSGSSGGSSAAVRFTSDGSTAPSGSSGASSLSEGDAGGAGVGSSALVPRAMRRHEDSEGEAGAGGRATRSRRVKLADMPEGVRKRIQARRDALRSLSYAFPPGVDASTVFAVVNHAGRQYKVTEGDVINGEHVKGVAVGSTLTLPVSMLGSRSRTVLGRPTVPGAHVLVAVEEHCRDPKVVVFKKKRRKRYQRTQGHRRDVTRLRVMAISADMAAY